MCGICGFVAKEGIEKNLLHKMSKSILHRGPDDEGYITVDFNDETTLYKGDDTVKEFQQEAHINSTKKELCKIGFLHRRLSILDLSSAGHQPMKFQDKYTIIYNGEVYNFIEIRNELLTKGYSFKTDNDTEVILAAYDFWGDKCVEKFIGMWSFSIYDSTTNKMFLSRDRFGIKPLYYTFVENEFLFASEMKALLEHSKVSRKIDYKNMYHYFTFKKLPSVDATLISGIKELEPGTNMLLDCDSLEYKLNKYYNLEEAVKNTNLKNEDLYAKYQTLFKDSINLHMRSDVKVGSCLSGGLDSSAIVAFASELSKDTILNTFTATYKEKSIDESHHAKQVIDNFDNINPHFIYPSSKTFWKDIDDLIWFQESPFTGTSVFAQWEVMKLSKEKNIKVLLDGQGADEVLGGYSNFTGVYLLELLTKGKFIKFINMAKQIKSNRSVSIIKELSRALFYYMPSNLKKLVIDNRRLNSKIISSKYHKIFKDEAIEKPKFGFYNFSIYNITYGMKNLLRYEDRNSMAFSIESRVPFLDHRLVEYSLALPVETKLYKGWTKYILRNTIKDRLPHEIVWRKDKKGFITPQDDWKKELCNELNKFIEDIEIPNFFNKKEIQHMLTRENLNSTELSEIWGIFIFFKWAKLFKIEFEKNEGKI